MKDIKVLLDQKVEMFNNPSFINGDPISVPHRFSLKQDIEISGLFAAVFSWGQRKTIINKSLELMDMMDNKPYDFIQNHSDEDLKSLSNFKHRTFNYEDLLCFISFLKHYYRNHESLESAFLPAGLEKQSGIKEGIEAFYRLFRTSPDFLKRSQKHISSPYKKSACKRINMYLRWMVRKDDKGVDFGLWNKISMYQLMVPLDLHVFRIASRLKLITRKIPDWAAVEELTSHLRKMCPQDPVKYDFALFGMGIIEKEML